MNGKLALWLHYRCCDAALHAARSFLPRRARQDQLSLTLIYAAYSDMRRADVLPLYHSQDAPSYASHAVLPDRGCRTDSRVAAAIKHNRPPTNRVRRVRRAFAGYSDKYKARVIPRVIARAERRRRPENEEEQRGEGSTLSYLASATPPIDRPTLAFSRVFGPDARSELAEYRERDTVVRHGATTGCKPFIFVPFVLDRPYPVLRCFYEDLRDTRQRGGRIEFSCATREKRDLSGYLIKRNILVHEIGGAQAKYTRICIDLRLAINVTTSKVYPVDIRDSCVNLALSTSLSLTGVPNYKNERLLSIALRLSNAPRFIPLRNITTIITDVKSALLKHPRYARCAN
ncbi:hypothetical protein DBV15_10972 [Temnothorax longispinosus]|uniref:Uncharacterized protein n=1 Tax=Temnothorax longispinosus TaxID=300112 RepID=A0A4S2KYM6_9HYME|nr:hypothetical protein DBV15_10972 [Temnothorax longispinosus]